MGIIIKTLQSNEFVHKVCIDSVEAKGVEIKQIDLDIIKY